MDKCYRCNEVISMCPCDESTYTADDEISRLRAELAAWQADYAIVLSQRDALYEDAERYRHVRTNPAMLLHLSNAGIHRAAEGRPVE